MLIWKNPGYDNSDISEENLIDKSIQKYISSLLNKKCRIMYEVIQYSYIFQEYIIY